MEKQSTAYRLSFYISIAIIAVFLVFIFIIYRYSRELMRENIENHAIGISSKIIGVIKADVVTTQEVAKNTALQVPYYVQNGSIGPLLKGIISRYPFIQSITIDLYDESPPVGNGKFSVARSHQGIVYSENISVARRGSPQTNIDSLIDDEAMGWGEPYRSDFQNQVVAMYHVPVVVKNETGHNLHIGHIAVELSLTYIDNEIGKIKIGESGFAFLVSSSGIYLTHPRKDWILKENITNLSEQVYKGNKQKINEALDRSISGSFTAYPRILNFKKSWVYHTPIPENRWMLLFVMPYSELYSSMRVMLLEIILVSMVGILVLFFIVATIAKRVTDPLAQITAEIHKFSTAGRAKSSKNEFESLEKSFIQMQVWYAKFKHEQESNRQNEKLIKRDLEQASEIVRKIIPDESILDKVKDDVEISSVYKPAHVIGGDLYDYFLIDETHLLVAIGDVSGKGISAALFMGVAHTLLKSNASGKSAKNIVKEINKELFNRNQNQYFVTMFVAIIDLKTGALNYCNAAHTTSLILRKDGSVAELNEPHGLPLGLFINRDYAGSTAKLLPGDILFLYTDGITETQNSQDVQYGEKSLKITLSKMKDSSPVEITQHIEGAVRNFRNGGKQVDDYSMIALKFCHSES